LITVIIAIVVVIALVVGGWLFWQNQQNNNTGINTKEYQAVFLTNGQNYFGKLVAFNSKYMQLTDVYYLQTSTDSTSQSTNADAANYQLVKLGNELHGPEDQMMIAKDQILFYENLKPTGKVAQLIAKDQKN
jgi:predicted negative regulator of RcsB-dependent stress response